MQRVFGCKNLVRPIVRIRMSEWADTLHRIWGVWQARVCAIIFIVFATHR